MQQTKTRKIQTIGKTNKKRIRLLESGIIFLSSHKWVSEWIREREIVRERDVSGIVKTRKTREIEREEVEDRVKEK